ncbi:MAG: MarC family protein [Pseudomonadota bacterium]
MDFSTVDLEFVVQMLLLLLIGMGPKIALVPFLEKTKTLTRDEQRLVAENMVKIAVITALILYLLGALLLRLLHISTGAVSIAGGIVLLLLALRMVSSPGEEEHLDEAEKDLGKLAVYPLAVPYLLNPVGITVVIVASAGVETALAWLVVLAIILLVGAMDWFIFRNMDKIAKRLNPTSLAISEVVFGILLAAVAVQLAYAGFVSLGILEAAAGHH